MTQRRFSSAPDGHRATEIMPLLREAGRRAGCTFHLSRSRRAVSTPHTPPLAALASHGIRRSIRISEGSEAATTVQQRVSHTPAPYAIYDIEW